MSDKLKDPALEEQLASVVLQRPELLDKNVAPPEIFTDESLSSLISMAVAMRFENEQITPDNLFAYCHDADMKLRFMQVTSRGLPTINAETASRRLVQLTELRDISRTCSRYHDLCFKDDADSGELMSDFESEILNLRNSSTGKIKSGADISQLEESVFWRAENPKEVRGLRWGMPKMEALMDGFRPGLHLIAARPSVGKTALATTAILGFLERLTKPAVFSLEMSEVAFQERILASRTGVQVKVTTNRAYTDEELQKLQQGMAWMKRQNWSIQDDPKIDCSELCSQIRRMKNQEGVDVVIIDYIQLLRYKKFRKEGKRIEVGEVSGALKRLSGDLKIPIIALAQLKRKDGYYDRATKKTLVQPPELEDLKESGDLEQDADTVILIDRDQKSNSDSAKLIIAKQREGPTGQVWVDYDPSTTRFTEAQVDL